MADRGRPLSAPCAPWGRDLGRRIMHCDPPWRREYEFGAQSELSGLTLSCSFRGHGRPFPNTRVVFGREEGARLQGTVMVYEKGESRQSFFSPCDRPGVQVGWKLRLNHLKKSGKRKKHEVAWDGATLPHASCEPQVLITPHPSSALRSRSVRGGEGKVPNLGVAPGFRGIMVGLPGRESRASRQCFHMSIPRGRRQLHMTEQCPCLRAL